MNRRLASSLVLISALLLCSQFALAQQNSSTTGDKAADAELREKAFQLLGSLADQISMLQSVENRARMGSNIAASLWTHDEKRARALFKLVEDDIKLGLQVEKSPDADHTFQVFYKLRENTAERMAQHDPELALAFVRNTVSFVNEYARLPSGGLLPLVAQKEHEFELRLAKQVGAGDPAVAVKLARQSLAKGLTRDLLPVLRRASKDKAQALMLYKEIVNKLRDANFDAWQTFEFAQGLALSYTPPAADESTYRELLQIFLTKAFAGGCANPRSAGNDDDRISFCSEMASLVPFIERFYPVEARRLRHWLPESEDFRPGLGQAFAELNEVAEDGSIDEMLSLTSKYPNIEGNIRLKAMWMAEVNGDWERAEKIASSYNGDPETRKAMDERVRYYKNLAASAEQEWTAAQKNEYNLPLHVRTQLLLNLAHNIALLDKTTARKALAQLSAMIDSLPPGKEHTTQQILLATVYCLTKNDRGFGIMEGLLPKLNELVAAAAKLDGYDSRYLRDGEWNMSAEGNVGNILTLLANSAGYFAWCDFDRAVTLAGQFERSEIRMMAQLKLAQGILAGPPRRMSHRVNY